jgi:hypothetical protein
LLDSYRIAAQVMCVAHTAGFFKSGSICDEFYFINSTVIDEPGMKNCKIGTE